MKATSQTARPEFASLVKEHYQALFRFAHSMARNPDDASDLVQQTFLIWAEKGDKLRDAAKVKSWLFTTLYREFLRLHRKNQRQQSQEHQTLEALAPPIPAGNIRRMEAADAMQALQTLDETYRAPLTLFYLEDMSYKEISETLDIPIGTVMSRLSRAKSQLKNILAEKS
jgi:RNA polymerase sigma factor (sigma-70 family)